MARSTLSVISVCIAIFLSIIFDHEIADIVPNPGVVLGILSIWATFHVYIISRNSQIPKRYRLYRILKVFIKSTLVFIIVLILLFMLSHRLFAQYKEGIIIFSGTAWLDAIIVGFLKVLQDYYKISFIPYYVVVVILVGIWFALKEKDNQYRGVLLTSMTNWHSRLQGKLDDFARDTTNEQFMELLSICLNICRTIPQLSIGRLINRRPNRNMMSAWIFIPDYQRERFDIIRWEGSDEFHYAFKMIKEKYKVTFYKEDKFTLFTKDKTKRRKKNDIAYNLEKEKIISACGYVFAKQLCKSFPNLDRCKAFSHGYRKYLKPAEFRAIKFKSMLATAIEHRGKTVGVLMLLSSKVRCRFLKIESEALRQIGYVIGHAISLAAKSGKIIDKSVIGN